MRRLFIGCSAAALLLAGGALASSTAVQATTPPSSAPAEGQPIVGAWWLSVDEFPGELPNARRLPRGRDLRGSRY